MFGMYRVIRVTPGADPIGGAVCTPQSGWMNREAARALAYSWAPNTSDRQVLQIERRFGLGLTDDAYRGQSATTRWSL